MIADCLTKTGRLGEDLLNVVRTGSYNIPGGVKIRDSTRLNIKTWEQLMNAEKEGKNSSSPVMKMMSLDQYQSI